MGINSSYQRLENHLSPPFLEFWPEHVAELFRTIQLLK